MSTGFTFGAKTAGAPSFGTGNINFGTPPQSQPQQQFSFATPASTAPSLFGTPTTTTTTLGFKPAGFGLGAVTSQPSTGFTFAPSAPAGLVFGAPASSAPATGLAFGTPASNAPTTGLTFGTPASGAPATGLAFGTPASSAPATGLAFGTPASNAPATGLAFGTPASSAPATGLAFGTPASNAPATGLTFGTPAASTGLSFGTPATTAPGLSFGTPASSVGSGLTFGTPATTSAGLSFGTPAASTGLSFGNPATTSTGLSFGTTSAPSSGLSFGVNTSTAPTLGLNFGQTSTAAPTLNFNSTSAANTTGLNFGLGGISTTSATTTGFGLNLTTTTTAHQNVGLGGIPLAQNKTGTAATAQKEIPPKEQPLPNEFLQTVEQFKCLIQEEKNRSSEVARCSVKEFHKVETELDSLNYQLNQIENQLQTYRKLAEQLKYDTAKSLQNIEIAQRTQDTPPGLQYDNNAPLQFFIELAENFEREMQFLKTKIDNTEKYVKKCGESTVLTSQDLAIGLKQLHETFVALAGRMQSIHNQVEAQKENFLSFRKQAYRDFVNPFETTEKLNETVNTIMNNTLITPPKLASGPTPFNNIALGTSNLALNTQQQNPLPATTTSALGFGSGNTTFGSLFGNQSNTSMFQLQQPPTGNKRGKQ